MTDSLSNLKAELDEKSKHQEVEGLDNNSSLKSLGAIVFNSGTLATNVAIMKLQTGWIQTLALLVIILNSLAIVFSTLQMSYGRPSRIRDLPTNEVGLVAQAFQFVFSLFKIGGENMGRNSASTTDDRIDELDHDVIGLKQDLLSLSIYTNPEDALQLQEVYQLLDRISFQNPHHTRTMIAQKDPASGSSSMVTGKVDMSSPPSQDNAHPLSLASGVEAATGPDSKRPRRVRKQKKGVSEEDIRVRAQLLDPTFIQAFQKAKRVVSSLREADNKFVDLESGQGGTMYRPVMQQHPLAMSMPMALVMNFQGTGAQTTTSSFQELKGLQARAMSRVPQKAMCSWACCELLTHGSLLRLFACCGSLAEDPYMDEDFWFKRKRVLLNITNMDTVRKDLAARLTESSSSWAYPLWVQQLNMFVTLIGLIVLVLDIVVATYAGSALPTP